MNFRIRKAEEKDLEFLFNLRNDPEVRKFSRNSDVIDLETHSRWFKKKLASHDSVIFVAEVGAEPIAQVRFDLLNNEEVEVSVAVAALFRGKGYGSEILKQASEQFLKEFSKVNKIYAFINLGNKASLRSFGKAGYQRCKNVDDGGVVRHRMILAR